ncbi:prepilin-type N-terminal cleavage/methylation domain-containing protein [Alteromonas pelagimontana]|uniref:Prepilin-type N-terminal cleavage/methylation domain-containing protein n=1 Tax=Alteromonas pelagimontana TaxID=1858656 RepID=A0A6M4MAK6_9ALTE|nr:prepilin-type N-terminal cleavage/methylation domain-containing protein [Alteromonas pelagimontana]QJR80009.1 prepilin-type N-terminal cleavage/methylation domain-containing protein [Alteromonas pelagimontana]
MKQVQASNQKGFTLIELMIVVAIIGILAAIALPAYQNYTKKARFSEVMMATQNFKTAIEVCYQTESDITECTAGENGVPNNITAGNGKGLVDSVIWTETGTNPTLVSTAATSNGLSGEAYTLTATVEDNGQLTWAETCSDAALC